MQWRGQQDAGDGYDWGLTKGRWTSRMPTTVLTPLMRFQYVTLAAALNRAALGDHNPSSEMYRGLDSSTLDTLQLSFRCQSESCHLCYSLMLCWYTQHSSIFDQAVTFSITTTPLNLLQPSERILQPLHGFTQVLHLHMCVTQHVHWHGRKYPLQLPTTTGNRFICLGQLQTITHSTSHPTSTPCRHCVVHIARAAPNQELKRGTAPNSLWPRSYVR
jgi:hypothetical protein